MAAELHHTPHLLGPSRQGARAHPTEGSCEASLFPTTSPPPPAPEPCPEVTAAWKRWKNACNHASCSICFPTGIQARYTTPLHPEEEARPDTCPDPRLRCGTTSEPASQRASEAPKQPGSASVRPREPVARPLGPRGVETRGSFRHSISPKSRRQCDARAEEGTLAKCKNTAHHQHFPSIRDEP